MKQRFYSDEKWSLSPKDIENLSCVICGSSLPATVFSHLPQDLKQHCMRVSAITGAMARQIPKHEIPEGLTRDEYVNALRCGSLYHDIGAWLVYNQRRLYPEAGAKFLREQTSEGTIHPAARCVILETVRCCREQYDGQGFPEGLVGEDIPMHAQVCAIAIALDKYISTRQTLFTRPARQAKRFIEQNKGTWFGPKGVQCFLQAWLEIEGKYQEWEKE